MIRVSATLVLAAALLPVPAAAQTAASCEPAPATQTAATSRYFIAMAARSGVFYDKSGPAFPMLIKATRGHGHIDAVGIYAEAGRPIFGTVPPTAFGDFMKDTTRASDVLLRLEITPAQYDRALKVVRTWERRARENVLLYPDIALDNILLAKQVTESLTQCGEPLERYPLDWGLEDTISEINTPSLVPFKFFQEMKRLNQSRHVPDAAFPVHHF